MPQHIFKELHIIFRYRINKKLSNKVHTMQCLKLICLDQNEINYVIPNHIKQKQNKKPVFEATCWY